MLEPYLLRHFIAVAETRSFTRAAEELNSTQSVVSRTIKRLEEIVGTPLIYRTTRSVSLTPAGEAYLVEVRLAVERIALATEKARRIGHGPHAKLRVAACPSVNPLLFADGLDEFRSRWPDVELELKPMFGLHQAQALRAAEIDIGIHRRAGSAQLSDIRSSTIAREALMVVVPAAWRMSLLRAPLADFRDRPWIFPDPQVAPMEFERQLQICRTAGFEPKIVGTARDSAESCLLLATGFGAMFAFRADAGPDVLRGYEFVEIDDALRDCSEISLSWAVVAASELISEFVSCVTPDPEIPKQERKLSLTANLAVVTTALATYFPISELMPLT